MRERKAGGATYVLSTVRHKSDGRVEVLQPVRRKFACRAAGGGDARGGRQGRVGKAGGRVEGLQRGARKFACRAAGGGDARDGRQVRLEQDVGGGNVSLRGGAQASPSGTKINRT